MKGRRPNEHKKVHKQNKTKQNKRKQETKKPRNQASETNEAKGGFCGRIPPVVSGGSKKEIVIEKKRTILVCGLDK